MDLFSGIDTSLFKIEKFIFHVVHHGQDDPILLDETPIKGHEPFFLGRLQDTLSGNRFEFSEHSPTMLELQNVTREPESFVPVSKNLAKSFHQVRNDNIKPGVMILMLISAGPAQLFSIIKYDHDEVLRYKMQGGTRAVLEEIKNSFTKSKKSLHKSAIIRLDSGDGELIVIDQKVRHDISVFFKNFLGVRRKASPAAMTQTVGKVFIETVRKHREILPKSITQSTRRILYDIVSNTDAFEAETFYQQSFGAHGNDKIHKTFMSKLKQNDLDGEQFTFDKKALTAPPKRKYETAEGVRIQYDQRAENTVVIDHGGENDLTKITITTTKLTEQ